MSDYRGRLQRLDGIAAPLVGVWAGSSRDAVTERGSPRGTSIWWELFSMVIEAAAEELNVSREVLYGRGGLNPINYNDAPAGSGHLR